MAETYDNLLTEADAAAYLAIHRATLWNWRRARIGLPYVRLGTRIRYRLSDLNAYIAAQTIQATRMPRPISGRIPGQKSTIL